MLLLRHTSKGNIALDFQGGFPRLGFNVSVSVFDDAGWMEETARWSPRGSNVQIPEAEFQSSLAKTITAGTGLPPLEAEELSGEALRQWRERGGEREGRGDAIKGLGLVTAIGSVILFVLAAMVAAVIFAVLLLTDAI